jgi:hypothetical protein
MYFHNLIGTGSYTTSTTNMYNKDRCHVPGTTPKIQRRGVHRDFLADPALFFEKRVHRCNRRFRRFPAPGQPGLGTPAGQGVHAVEVKQVVPLATGIGGKGREREGKGGKGREREGKGGKGREWEGGKE